MLKTIMTMAVLFLAVTGAQAQLWQCPTSGGGSTYQDKPCAKPQAPPQMTQPQAPSPAAVSQGGARQELMLDKGTLACLTSTHFNQAVEAQSQKDARGFQFLLDKKICLITPRDLPVSLLYDNPRGPSQIRLYTEDGTAAIVLWTYSAFMK